MCRVDSGSKIFKSEAHPETVTEQIVKMSPDSVEGESLLAACYKVNNVSKSRG